MTDLRQTQEEMRTSESAIREALSRSTVSERMQALSNLYWDTPIDKRDSIAMVLIARLSLTGREVEGR